MTAGAFGFTVGLFVMSFAVAVILQFALMRGALKKRLRGTYMFSGAVGLLLLFATLEFDLPHLIAGAALIGALIFCFKRDASKLALPA